MKRIFNALAVLFVAIPVAANIINVPNDYSTIQAGIDASIDGDTVLVEDGTYTGAGNRDIDFNGKGILLKSENGPNSTIIDCQGNIDYPHRGIVFDSDEDSSSIIDGFAITSGFAPAFDFELLGGGIFIYNSSPEIKNCIIGGNSAGHFNSSHQELQEGFGGGIYCRNSFSTISGCRFEGNIAEHGPADENDIVPPGRGGGLYGVNANIVVSNSIIGGNLADMGAGIYCESGSPVINNNEIEYNDGTSTYGLGDGISTGEYCSPVILNNTISGNSGSGIFAENATISGNIITGNSDIGVRCFGSTLSNNIISGNSGSFRGAGVVCGGSNISGNIITANIVAGSGGGIYSYDNSIISQNIICGNSAINGGGIAIFYNSTCSVVNNTIVNNSANETGGGLFCDFDIDLLVVNSIFWDNSAGEEGQAIYYGNGTLLVLYCDIQGGWDGEGNIDIDPLFRNPLIGDFRLMTGDCGDPNDSPCIDAGSPAFIDSLLDCDWGLAEQRSDMGAYGGGDSVEVEIHEIRGQLPGHMSLSQNYPNPFNSSTIIEYNLPTASEVTIDIYDILGRRVETLVQGEQAAGSHQALWNASDAASGIYFYKIQSGDRINTRKMILIK